MARRARAFPAEAPAAGQRIDRALVSHRNSPRRPRGLQGVSIAFVVVTAVLLVATIEREINAIWGVREPRSWPRRVFVYAVGVTAGPLLHRCRDLRDDLGDWRPRSRRRRSSRRRWQFHRDAACGRNHDARLHAALCDPARATRAASGRVVGRLARRTRHSKLPSTDSGSTSRQLPTYEVIYGTLAVVPLFLFWIYVSWYVILVGAAVTATLGRRRSARTHVASR